MGIRSLQTGSVSRHQALSGVWRKAFCMLGLSWLGFSAPCQSLWYGIGAGAVNYQGELRGSNFTDKGARLMLGTCMLLETNGILDLLLDFQHGVLSGSDVENPKYLTRRRNLHFETRLDEASILARLRLGRARTSPVSPFLTTGMAAFRIDPYTFDGQGKKWMLFPLSTEGQGLANYPDIPQNRKIHLAIPLGAGIELKLSRRIRADMTFMLRKTFTDRIDDVSGAYPDENMLLSAKGFKALDLSYRTDELPYESLYFPVEGTLRGNPASKDAYYSLMLRLRYSIGTGSMPYERIRYIFRDDDWPYRF